MRQGMQRTVRALAHPSPYKIPGQWRTRVNSLGELNDDVSHAVTAVLNSNSHSTLVTGIGVMW